MKVNVVAKRRFRRKRIRWWYVLVAAVAIWGAYVYFFVQQPELTQQDAEKVRLTSELKSSKSQYHVLDQQVQELHQSSYIGYIAQKKYNLVKPGEILFVSKSAGSN